MYRQGDILLVYAHEIPMSAQQQANCVLAVGEATGHQHQIITGALLWMNDDETKYVEVTGNKAILVHEEHGPITLSGPAMYKIVQQREYVPGAIRYVAD